MNSQLKAELNLGVRRAAELRERLGVSPATLMRMVRGAGSDVVRIGRGRASRYALRQTWPNLNSSRFPVFRITEVGTAASAGELITLAGRQSVWMPFGKLDEGLPVELADSRPDGFLGRQFVVLHADLHLPPRVTDWSDHHTLLAMSRRGEDLPGNLIVGDESFARWQAINTNSRSRNDYPAIAEDTVAGHPPSSSAGGERPKFCVLVDGHHVLVKFVARGSGGDAVARRWSDLLILERLALEVVSSHGIAAARTTVIETPSHWFLESQRFDRVGVKGRVGVLSLAAVHDDLANSWAAAAVSLRAAGRLSDQDARALRWLDAFGALIGNTDRHQYNILFFTEEAPLRLAPTFDQVCMLYAPTADGQVPTRLFTLPFVTADTLDVWDDARQAAHQFWGEASEDLRVSDDVRRICAENMKLLMP